MTHTLVASATRQHIIGFDRPFTVIGERINPTGRKKLAAEMQAGNFETVIKDALAQVAAGAHILDSCGIVGVRLILLYADVDNRANPDLPVRSPFQRHLKYI